MALGLLVLWSLVALACTVATARWARRLWARRDEMTPGMGMMASMAVTAGMLGTLGTLGGLIPALAMASDKTADPPHRARLLAEGISAAMNCTVFGLVGWLPSAIGLMVAMRKRDGQRK